MIQLELHRIQSSLSEPLYLVAKLSTTPGQRFVANGIDPPYRIYANGTARGSESCLTILHDYHPHYRCCTLLEFLMQIVFVLQQITERQANYSVLSTPRTSSVPIVTLQETPEKIDFD